METHDWISLFSAALVAVGWLATGFFSRRNNIALKRTDLRLKFVARYLRWVKDFVEAANDVTPFQNNPTLVPRLQSLHDSFNLYGTRREIAAFHKLADALAKRRLEIIPDLMNTLTTMLISEQRRLIGLCPKFKMRKDAA